MREFVVAGHGDLDFVRALWCRPENALFLTDFDEAEFEAACDAQTLLVWKPMGHAAGFVNTINWLPGNVAIAEMAVAVTGNGQGGLMLDAFLDGIFADPVTHRVGLDATIDNTRALKLYERLGFVREGVFRECWRRQDGALVDCVFLAILRREWRARRDGPHHLSNACSLR